MNSGHSSGFQSKHFNSIRGKFRDWNSCRKTCCAKRKSLPLEITVSSNSTSLSKKLCTGVYLTFFCLLAFAVWIILLTCHLNRFLVSDFQKVLKRV